MSRNTPHTRRTILGKAAAGSLIVGAACLATAAATAAPVQPSSGSGDSVMIWVGTNGADRMIGSKHADRIKSRGGNDRIRTRGGDDIVDAGPGADRITPGPGADRVKAGPGRDWITLGNDGDRDVVRCGGGSDMVVYTGVTDPADRLHGCEQVLSAHSGPDTAP